MEAQTRKPTDFPAVEPQPEQCEDTISRQSAIQAAECIVDHHAITPYQTMRSAMDHLQRILRGMPSVQPEWIPCSERLPEEDHETGMGVQYSDYVLMTVFNEEDDETVIDYGQMRDGEWYSISTDIIIPNWWKVIAWMPLPEPYKGDQDGQN